MVVWQGGMTQDGWTMVLHDGEIRARPQLSCRWPDNIGAGSSPPEIAWYDSIGKIVWAQLEIQTNCCWLLIDCWQCGFFQLTLSDTSPMKVFAILIWFLKKRRCQIWVMMEVEVWGRSRRADVSMQMQKRSQRCSLVQIWGLRPPPAWRQGLSPQDEGWITCLRFSHCLAIIESALWQRKVNRIPWSGQEAQMARKNGGTVIKWSRESAWLESSACSFYWQCTQPCMAQQNELCNSGESISFPLRHQLPRPQSTLMTHFLKPHHTLGNGSSEWATGAIIMGLLLTY